MEEKIELESLEEERLLFGPRDRWRRLVMSRFPVELVSRNGVLKILGDDGAVREARQLLEGALASIRAGDGADGVARLLGGIDVESRAGPVLAPGIQPKTEGQEHYVRSLGRYAITIVLGPAGTGKTFLAVAGAVAALRRGEYRKLVLARPAVEAGERLGFLPGDLNAKVNPYLRPLLDALFALMEAEQVRKYLENDVIEVVPLAYMRGRTLDRSYIILDEAQNTTTQQMKMFLTRMGRGSRIVVTGDPTQTDLPAGMSSGLMHSVKILRQIDGIGVVELTRKDIVRHPLVRKIVRAYERDEGLDVADEDGDL